MFLPFPFSVVLSVPFSDLLCSLHIITLSSSHLSNKTWPLPASTLSLWQFDRAYFKRSVLLFVENNRSQSRAELEHQCPSQKLPRDWRRERWMEIFLDAILGHRPDVIICKHTHICAVVTDFFSLLLEYWVGKNIQSLCWGLASEAEISGEK